MSLTPHEFVENEQSLYAIWDAHQFEYYVHVHPPIFTVNDGKEISQAIPGAHSKNLFLKDKKGAFFLVSVLENKRVNLKQLSKEIGQGGLSFGSPIDLQENLNLTPGSVTPFGLIYPKSSSITFILDEDFLHHNYVNFHPLRNDKTVQMACKDFLQFFEILSRPMEIRHLPTLTNGSSHGSI